MNYLSMSSIHIAFSPGSEKFKVIDSPSASPEPSVIAVAVPPSSEGGSRGSGGNGS